MQQNMLNKISSQTKVHSKAKYPQLTTIATSLQSMMNKTKVVVGFHVEILMTQKRVKLVINNYIQKSLSMLDLI
jgi:hypothetical protein